MRAFLGVAGSEYEVLAIGLGVGSGCANAFVPPGCVRQRRSVVGFHSEETSEFDHTTATRQDKTGRKDKSVCCKR
jgi:hypothetical protein